MQAAGRAGADVSLMSLTRHYGDVTAVSDISLRIESGEFLTLLGPSGSGKTTTLMMIAGFVQPSAGDIRIGGRSVVDLPPHRRNIGVVFQSYALFPHMSVFDNVAFPLRMRHIDQESVHRRVADALSMVRLRHLEHRRIQQLSGGQQQRVALARALVFEPPLLLMDEPLGALDRKLREQMQLEIKRIQKALGVTVVYVTHDQDEALMLSNRIAVMHDGIIQQVGTPAQIYERPANMFVAQFVGESNSFDGVVDEVSPVSTAIHLPAVRSRIHGPVIEAVVGQPVRAVIRPEALSLHSHRTAVENSVNAIEGCVEEVVYLGQAIRYTVRVGDLPLTVRLPHQPGASVFESGARVTITWSRPATLLLP
jgi:spermidine/putrescine ABC transporter ATP-binding subunit